MTDRDPLEWLIGIIGMRNLAETTASLASELGFKPGTQRVDDWPGAQLPHAPALAALAPRMSDSTA